MKACTDSHKSVHAFILFDHSAAYLSRRLPPATVARMRFMRPCMRMLYNSSLFQQAIHQIQLGGAQR